MKRLFTLFMLAFVAMSCEQIQDFIDDKGHGLVFLEGEMKAYFDDKGDTKNYKFNADLAWSAEVSAEWVEVNPTSGPAGENKIQIKVDKNKSDEKRTGYVDITLSNDKSYRIELEQLAAGENLDDITPSTTIPNNEIWYTNGNTTEPTTPNQILLHVFGAKCVFGANIVSNNFDADKECWVIKFDGEVTTIGEDAFSRCSSLTSITIPDSVTTIGECAFGICSSLTTFKGRYASEDGRCLIIDGVLNSFAPADLTEYTIPDSVTTIGDWAFHCCSSLTSITIPDSVTIIGDWAFYSCSSLTSITIPDSVTAIGIGAFSSCSSLREFNGKYASEDGRCLIIDGTLTSFAPAGLTKYTIPDSVTTIVEWAFDDCSSLTSVTIGDSVTTIGTYAFSGCSSLTSVTIPDSVATIGEWAFYDCRSLTRFNGIYASEDGRCLIINGTLTLFAPAGLTKYTIPDSVITIGDTAFANCLNLTSITIPESVTIIGYDAFGWCSSLTSVYCRATTPPTAILNLNSYDGYWYAFAGNASGRIIYVPTESVDAYKSANGWSNYADAIFGYEF